MGGLQPGGTLKITHGASTLVNSPISESAQWFSLPAGMLPVGAILKAQQTVPSVPASPAVSSLPVAAAGPLTAPELADPPLYACQTSIGWKNMTPGSDLKIENGGTDTFATSGWEQWTLVDMAPLKAGTLTAQQYYNRCKQQHKPGPIATFTVAKKAPPLPTISYTPCTNVHQLTVGNLIPGELLTVSRVVGSNPATVVGAQGVSTATATVELPPSFQATDPGGPVSIEIAVTLCGVKSPVPGYTKVAFPASPGGPYPAPKLYSPLYDCARAVQVLGAHPGSLLQVFSDPSGLPRSGPVVAATADPVIPLWSPLNTGEQIFVKVTGCNAKGPTPKVTVKPVPSPFNPPQIATPVFAGASEVTLTGVYQGAQLYLFRDNTFWSHLDTNDLGSFGSTVAVPAGNPALAIGDKLTATQALCGSTSVSKQGGPGGAVVTRLYIRREAWGLEGSDTFDPITLAYAKAVKELQSRSPSDPTSWTYQAAMHATYTTPALANWDGCQHGGWFFLPWHRMYLYFFERIVRAAVTAAGGPVDFALPYWNYDRPNPGNTIPPAFRAATLPDGTANPLYLASPRRDVNYMSGAQFDPSLTSPAAALADTNFTSTTSAPSFGSGKIGPVHFAGSYGDLELTPHNAMHPAIGGAKSGLCAGGLMTDPGCSALDPIFFLHHGNIDRLWNTWIASGGGRADPTDASWNNQSFNFFDETGATVTMTVAEVLDTASQLSYIYDDQPSPLMMMKRRLAEDVVRETPQERSGPPELVAASDSPLTLRGSSASVVLNVPDKTRYLIEPTMPGSRRVLVSVDDIKAEDNPGTPYGVYLNLPPEAGADLRRSYHVGTLGLFGIERMNDPDTPPHSPPGFSHMFNATPVVARLQEETRWDPARVTITFQPILPLPPAGEEATWKPQLPDPSTIPPVEIGRVGIFVD
jgi:hypothetical protein